MNEAKAVRELSLQRAARRKDSIRHVDELADWDLPTGVVYGWVDRISGLSCDKDDPNAIYKPSPQEISAATAEIRESWSEYEYFHRAGLAYSNSPYMFAGSCEARNIVRSRNDKNLPGVVLR